MRHNKSKRRGPARRRTPALLAGALTALGAANGAHAFEINTGNPDIGLRWDNTVRYNLSTRVENKDPKIANAPNTDESDNKFDRGDIVNNRVDLLSELDFVYKNRMGVRVTGAAWYDHGYADDDIITGPGLAARGSYDNNNYSSYTKRWYRGPSGEILDAFVFGNFDIGPTTLRVKAGKHSLFWGDVTFNANHSVAYSQMPNDSRKSLASPGVEAKETVLPLNQISAQLQITDTLAVAGQYFLDWKPNRLPEGGTYYGAADFLFYGPDKFSLSPALTVRRADAVEPDDRGNWGMNVKWSPSWLDGTLGFYYRKFDERQPWSAPQVVPTPTGFYRLVYAKGTELYGVGLNKNIGGFAVAAEVSMRKNTAFINSGINPATLEGPRGDSYHAFINATTLGNLSARMPYTAVAELAYSRWDKVRSNPNLFNAEGFAGCSAAAAGFACATKDYFGVSFLFAPRILQVIPGGDLTIPLFLQGGIKGNAATLSGGNQEAGNYSLGLQLDYLSKYIFAMNYSDFFGRYRHNGSIVTVGNGPLYRDRGLLTFSFRTSF
jgi:Protein of unknown function (DUF1302)